MAKPTRKGLVRRTIDWIGSHEPVVLVMVGVVVAATWAFIELADEVVEGETDRIDRAVLLALRDADQPQDPLGPQWLEEAVRDVTALGGVTVLVLVTVGVAGFLWLEGKRAVTLWILLAVLGGLLVGQGLKQLFDRPRPDLVPHLAQVYTTSFPSGHSMMAAVTYLTLSTMVATTVLNRRLRFYIITLGLLVTLLVGVSRVYLGVHYPTDVLGGWMAGLTWALLSRLLMRRWLIAHPEAAAATPNSDSDPTE